MRFARPDILWAMALVMPLLIGFLWWTWRERQKLIAQFVQSRLLSVLTVGVSKPRQKLRLWLLASAVALSLVALSRPQWGFGYQEVKQKGLDIVIGIDTSRSMLAEDVPPNRLQKAKLAALDLRQLAKSDRMGLVAFAGSAFLQMPMSLDENAFRQHLEALDTRLLPQGGTALAEAIQTARTAFKAGGEENHRALVLFTDGEDHDGQAIEAAAQAAKEGMVVFTIGLGSSSGELIPVRDAKGRVDFIKDENGNAVKSRLNEGLLQDIAKAGKGFYLHLTGPGAMEMLYERGLAPLPKRDLQATLMRRYFERFQWFLAAAFLLLIAEMFVVDFKTPLRRRTAPDAPTPAPLSKAGVSVVGIILSLVFAQLAEASPSSARREYDSGKFKNALNEYESLLEKKPKDASLHYNAGTAAFQAGKFQDAEEHFESALATQDARLQQQAYYNRGNTRYRLGEDAGDPSKTQKLWEDSIRDFESALKLNPQDSDAQHNLSWVKERLEELKKQQQQQKQDSDSQNKDDQKEKQDKEKNKDQDQKQDKDQDKDQKDSQDQKDPKNDQKQDKDQDQSSQEKKDQEKSSQEKKDSQQQDSKKEDQQQGQEEQKSAQDERDKQDGSQSKAGQQGDTNSPSATQPQGGTPMSTQPMQMSQREAIRLLEALRSEEKLFLPPPPQQPRKNQRRLKDW